MKHGVPVSRRERARGVLLVSCGTPKGPRCANECGREATLACEYPLTGRATGATCGKKLCATCAVNVTRVAHLAQGESFDLCPAHANYDRVQRIKAERASDLTDGVGPVAGVRRG